MANRNPSDLDREQRGSSNPNQTDSNESRSTRSDETGDTSRSNTGRDRNQGVGDESLGSESDDLGNVGSSRDTNRPSGNIEGNEDRSRR